MAVLQATENFAAGEPRPKKPWYGNVYVLLIACVSLVAASMAALMLLLLPQSSEIVRFMQWRMVNARTAHVDAVIEYRGDIASKDENGVTRRRDESFTVEAAGQVDRTDPARPTSRFSFGVSLGQDGGPRRVTGEYAGAGGATFLLFSAFPERVGAVRFADFTGRWLRVDAPRILSATALPGIGGERRAFTDADRVTLAERFHKTPFLRVEEKLKTETLGGVRSYHYKVRPEILHFKDYFIFAESLRLGRELTAKERLAADAFFANVVAEDGELWISARDYSLRRIRLRFAYDDGARVGRFSVTADVSGVNAPAAVTLPSGDAQDVTAIIESLLPGFGGKLPLAKDGLVPRSRKAEETQGLPVAIDAPAASDADDDGLPGELETFYGSDPDNPDTDGDGMTDGAEVDAGRNPTGPGLLFDFTGGRF